MEVEDMIIHRAHKKVGWQRLYAIDCTGFDKYDT
jgi:hypothetical protein